MASTSKAVPASPAGTIPKLQPALDKSAVVDGPYAKYVLTVLVVMGIFNFIDRQIFSILAEPIKADMGLSDSDLGFLFGTAFAVFYAVFGIPLGRLADSWCRTKQISLSVGFWSIMTALSGLTRSFVPLAGCRFGVGAGEAGASPAALSLLYDYFSPKVRTTVMAIYGSGASIGGGVGLFLGGAILGVWSNTWPDPSLAPFGLKGWQAAFMVVGLPGLLLSLLIWTLKEPVRGQAETLGIAFTPNVTTLPPTLHPLRFLFREMMPMAPGINLYLLRREGAGVNQLWLNIGIGLAIVLLVFLLMQATGDVLQWLSLGVGLYCVFSWAQVLVCRDPVCFGLIFQCKTLRYIYLYTGFQVFAGSALGFWMIPWFQRYFGIDAMQIATTLGLSFALGGLAGGITGGVVADRLRQQTQRGKLFVTLGSVLLLLLASLFMLTSHQVYTAYACAFVAIFATGMGASPTASAVSDLMIPRTRAIAMALYIMVMNLMGIALGPYCVGLLSDAIASTGIGDAEALQRALLTSLLVMGVSIVFLLLAIKHIANDEDSRLDRARGLGEGLD